MVTDTYEDTLYGQVLPLAWEGDRISEIVLLVDCEEEFIIDPGGHGKHMMNLIDRWVTVKGVVEETDDEFRIRVRDYKVDEEYEYDSEDKW